jgi:hypothetical protein
MFDNDEPTDDWFDHIGLGGERSADDQVSAGQHSEENNEGVASAIHGAVALLQSLHADRAAVPAAVESWAAVYGTATVEPDLDDLQHEFQARRPRTIPDAFMAGAVAMGDAISAPTSVLVSQQLAAHVRIEAELLKRLAQVTGRPVRDVLAYLEGWAAIETDDEPSDPR